MTIAFQQKSNLLAAALTVALLAAPALANAKTYTVGVVPQLGWDKTKQIWTPLLEELGERLGHDFQLARVDAIDEFAKRLYKGEFDVAYSNPYQSLVGRMKQGYEPVVRDTSRSLQGIIVVRKDDRTRSLRQLANKKVGFPAPNALAASLVLRAYIDREMKIKVSESFHGSHSKVYEAIINGTIDAGGGVGKTLKKQPKAIQDKLRILYTSRKIAPHPVIAHPRVGRKLQRALRKEMMSLADEDDGKAMLANIPIKEVGRAWPRDYKPLKYWGLREYEIN